MVDKILRLHSGSVDYLGSRDEFAAILQQRRQSLAEAKNAQAKGMAPQKPKAVGGRT